MYEYTVNGKAQGNIVAYMMLLKTPHYQIGVTLLPQTVAPSAACVGVTRRGVEGSSALDEVRSGGR